MTENQSKKKWYDNKLIITLLCIFFFPVGLYALWKNRFISKGWKIGVTAIIGLLVIASLGEDDENTNSETLSSNNQEEVVETLKEPEKDPEQELKEQLEREIKSLSEKKFNGSTYRESVQSIQMEIVLFNVWAGIIKRAENSTDEMNKKLGKQLRSKVKSIQVSEFPKLRKAYKDVIYDKLWLENIETKISGKGNTTLELTGGMFASNKAKQQTQETLSEILKMLRFKRVNYKFTKYDNEYTYYAVETPMDSEIVEIK